MAKARILTECSVETAKPKAARYGMRDGLVPNQQLIIQPSGEKSYAIFPRIHGKQVKITIGDASLMTLARGAHQGQSHPRRRCQRNRSARGQAGGGKDRVGNRRGRGQALHRALPEGPQSHLGGGPMADRARDLAGLGQAADHLDLPARRHRAARRHRRPWRARYRQPAR